MSAKKKEWHFTLGPGLVFLIISFLARPAFGQSLEEAERLNNQVIELYQQGLYREAIPLAERTLAIREKVLGPEHPDVATSLNNLASLYHDLGDYSRAEPLHQRVLAIREKVLGPEHPQVATSLNNLALLYLEAGRMEEAFKIFKKQDAAWGLGRYYLAKGDYKEAERQFLRSLKWDERSGRLEFLIADYLGLGLSCEGKGGYGRAREYFQQAIDLIEGQWKTLSLSARQGFLSGKVGAGFSRLEPYEGMVRVILQEKKKGYQREALLYAERVKSRTFLEMLAARPVKGKGKEDQEVLNKERKFQQDMAGLRKRISVLEGPGSKAPKGERGSLEKELERAASEYERFLKEIKLKDLELASLISVEAIPIERIQSLLDPDTTLLEYYTARDRLYAWLLSRDDIKVYEIALKERDLREKANAFRLSNISDRSRKAEPTITLPTSDDYKKETPKEERERNRKRFYQMAEDFYKLIMAPVEEDIKTDKLIIVPHGVLHKIPFCALSDGEGFMMDRYAISVLPASSVMEYIVKKRNPNQGRLLAFANPIADYVPGFYQLPSAEEEVAEIARHFKQKEVYTRREATEGLAKTKSADRDVIHFAAHGEFNDRQPLQSPGSCWQRTGTMTALFRCMRSLV